MTICFSLFFSFFSLPGLAYEGVVESYLAERGGFIVVYDDGHHELVWPGMLQHLDPDEDIYILL